MTAKRYRWAAPGDVNAFFGLMLDNIAGLILMVTLLATVFSFPADFAISHMVPGTAIGVLVGDLMFFVMAFYLAKRTQRDDVTAMPLGLDTPSTFGMVFFVLGPAFLSASANGLDQTEAARFAWHIGLWGIVLTGVFKLCCSFFCEWVRRNVPRAGLLGSLAAIALVLITFFPLMEIFAHPIVGFVAMAIVLTALVGKVPLPGRTPGTLAALIVAGVLFYVLRYAGFEGYAAEASTIKAQLFPTEWLAVFQFQWVERFGDALNYLPVLVPFAIGTVIGGIDCTESAAAAGDDYSTGGVIAVEGVATLIGGLCGGVIQTTPYIGHPAYKDMGGRAAYSLATGLFVGSAGLVGFFAYIYQVIPQAAVYPILVFIGLEITAQSFTATPKRHFAAIALACIPSLATLAWNFPNRILGALQTSLDDLPNPDLANELHIVLMLANGFILTSLLWASGLAAIIDHKLRRAGILFLICMTLTLFGVMHSPFTDAKMFVPWKKVAVPVEVSDATNNSESASVDVETGASEEPAEAANTSMVYFLSTPDGMRVVEFAIGYLLIGGMLIAWGGYLQRSGLAKEPEQESQEQVRPNL